MKKLPELLCPAGNFEKLRAAVLYGADAVYLAGNAFGMRAAADNFSLEQLREAMIWAHKRGVRVHVTVNTMPRQGELAALEDYLRALASLGQYKLTESEFPGSDDALAYPDALIVADLGVAALVRQILPGAELHVSTQAGAVNSADCMAWRGLGAKRIVLARELSLADIRAIRAALPADLELEAFVHGSMCVSVSGRCLLSNHFTGRDANRGMCTQPCRWNYRLYEIEEEKRPSDRLPVVETDLGTFVMSSKDMCMIEHLGELCEAGIASFKIEGRMKSAYYAAVTANAYRMALDAYGAGQAYDARWKRELESVSHRSYCTGYFFDDPMQNAQLCDAEGIREGYIREKSYIATAVGYDASRGVATFVQRNKLTAGDTVELISPGMIGRAFCAEELTDPEGNALESAPHPSMLFCLRVPFAVRAGDILRR